MDLERIEYAVDLFESVPVSTQEAIIDLLRCLLTEQEPCPAAQDLAE